jgi:hypothetical protein
MRLAMQDQRVYRAPDIVDRAVADELDRAGLRVDLDFGDMKAMREGRYPARHVADAVERAVERLGHARTEG